MIPKRMEAFLRERLPERTWKNRLVSEDGRCYMEFSAVDVDRLARLGIEVDPLGPRTGGLHVGRKFAAGDRRLPGGR